MFSFKFSDTWYGKDILMIFYNSKTVIMFKTKIEEWSDLKDIN